MGNAARLHAPDKRTPKLTVCGKAGLPVSSDPAAVTCKLCLKLLASVPVLPALQNQRLRVLNRANRMRAGYPDRVVFIIELNDRPEQYAHAYKSADVAQNAIEARANQEGLKVQKYVPAKD